MNLEEHLLLAHASRGHGLLPSLGHQDGASTPGSRSTASDVGGNPDFTNAPGHGDDDARYYNRQQAYVPAPDTPPRPPAWPQNPN